MAPKGRKGTPMDWGTNEHIFTVHLRRARAPKQLKYRTWKARSAINNSPKNAK